MVSTFSTLLSNVFYKYISYLSSKCFFVFSKWFLAFSKWFLVFSKWFLPVQEIVSGFYRRLQIKKPTHFTIYIYIYIYIMWKWYMMIYPVLKHGSLGYLYSRRWTFLRCQKVKPKRCALHHCDSLGS